MPNTTSKLSLNTWLENDVVDFEKVNENFEKLDNMVMCIESGTKTANFSGGTTSAATWQYKKFSDRTVEMSAKLEFTNLKCNGGSGSPYYSGDSKVYFPFSFSSVYDVQMHLASNTIGWVSDITGKSVLDYVMFRVMGTEYESENVYKQVFITVRGVLA